MTLPSTRFPATPDMHVFIQELGETLIRTYVTDRARPTAEGFWSRRIGAGTYYHKWTVITPDVNADDERMFAVRKMVDGDGRVALAAVNVDWAFTDPEKFDVYAPPREVQRAYARDDADVLGESLGAKIMRQMNAEQALQRAADIQLAAFADYLSAPAHGVVQETWTRIDGDMTCTDVKIAVCAEQDEAVGLCARWENTAEVLIEEEPGLDGW